MGTTSHRADLTADGVYDPAARLVALREPDGIALTPDGLYFVAADEGDTARGPSDDARSGELMGDTGGQLDDAAALAGVYPDHRSGKKGSEPEMITAFAIDGINYAAVGLERADALALIDLSDPEFPRVIALAPLSGKGSVGSYSRLALEGVAHYRDPTSGQHFVYSANEASETLGVVRVEF